MPSILSDLQKKMVILTGPRQIGKTWLAKRIMTHYCHPQYLNFDNFDDARIIRNQSWNHSADLLVFDEIHKLPDWKTFIKGVFDSKQPHTSILLTGSSRLDTFRQSGESLAGRYFHYRLHPFSVKELATFDSPDEALSRLMQYGGFPEPLLENSEIHATRWRRQYYTDLVREDVLDFSRIHEINTIRLLVELLRERVGSPVSCRSIGQDLQAAPNTIRKYIDILESLYIIFLVRPHHANLARAILKEPKVYFYDTGHVKGGDGIKLENACAVCLLKHVQFLQDTRGESLSLRYLRTKESHEVDFAVCRDDQIDTMIEVKLNDNRPDSGLIYLTKKVHPPTSLQLVRNLRQEESCQGISIVSAAHWLAGLSA